jgi:hypothetical protein
MLESGSLQRDTAAADCVRACQQSTGGDLTSQQEEPCVALFHIKSTTAYQDAKMLFAVCCAASCPALLPCSSSIWYRRKMCRPRLSPASAGAAGVSFILWTGGAATAAPTHTLLSLLAAVIQAACPVCALESLVLHICNRDHIPTLNTLMQRCRLCDHTHMSSNKSRNKGVSQAAHSSVAAACKHWHQPASRIPSSALPGVLALSC